MQQSLTAVVYNTSTGAIQYAIIYGNGVLPPVGTTPWQGGDAPEIETFPGAIQPVDSETALQYVLTLPSWNAGTALPAGLAIIAAPANFDPAQWFKWKVSGGELVEKTKVNLRLSGNQVVADSPISTTIQVGNPANPGSAFTVAMTAGVAQLSGLLPTGTPVFVVTSDANYWSDPNFFA